MVKENEEEKLKKQHERMEEQKGQEEQAAKMQRSAKKSGGFINQLQLLLTGLFFLIFYVAPLYIVPQVFDQYQ